MKQLFATVLSMSAVLAVGNTAAQSNYPTMPVRIMVGFPPGGTQDIVARLIGEKFAEAFRRPVLIDNVAGASGTIAAGRITKAAPDGYTLGLMGESALVIRPSLYKVTYDPVNDFAPVSQVTVQAIMLVAHNSVPAKNVKELVALAKAQPGVLTFATGGSGTTTHMAGELLKSMAGLDIRDIPYKGVVAAIPDLLGGRVMMTFSPIGIVLPLARDGKLRALAVTSSRRVAMFPELPTIAESGYPGFEVTIWYGLLAPAGTPAAIISKVHLETVKALARPDLRAKLAELSLEAMGNSPDEFAAVIKSGIPKWTGVIKASGIKPH